MVYVQIAGLAIYNGVILDLHFPKAIYRKMLGLHMTLDDLKEVTPAVGKSMQHILDYDGDDAEDVFCLMFTASYDLYGQEKEVELVRGAGELVHESPGRDLHGDQVLSSVAISNGGCHLP